jgi:tripartite-type tricarboxylate transporter receptor subunit TctC
MGAVLAVCATRSLANPKYPAQPVRMVVPHPPGQAADIFSRMLAERLSAMWGQQVVVDNRAGGAGLPAIAAVKAAKPDGYTMMMGTSSTLSINASTFSKLPYDTLRDFAPVSNVVIAPFVLIAHPAFPARTLTELVAQAKREPGKLTFASTGAGCRSSARDRSRRSRSRR